MTAVTSAPFLVITPLGDDADPGFCVRCQSPIGPWVEVRETVFIPYAVLYSEADDGDMGYCLECANAVCPLEVYVNNRYGHSEHDIDELVKAATIAARINGYGSGIDGMTAHEFAVDLCSYDFELEKVDVGRVEAAIVRYRLRVGADLP